LQRGEDFLGAVRLVHLQAANAGGEKRFEIAIVIGRHVRQVRERGGAIVAREISFGQSEIGIGPHWLQTRGFAQFAEARLIIGGQQAANVVLERIESQRPLGLGEIGERGAIRLVAFGEQAPDDFRLHVHQRIESTRFANGRKQQKRIGAQDARLDGQSFSVGGERAEDDEVGVEILRHAQHAGAAKLGGKRKTVALHFGGAPGVGINLLAAGGERLNGEFLEAFAEPVQARRCPRVFKGENQIDAGLRGGSGARRRVLGAERAGAKECTAKKKSASNETMGGHGSQELYSDLRPKGWYLRTRAAKGKRRAEPS
jgi:hypothetical protein